MKKFIAVITTILVSFTLVSCRFAKAKEFDLEKPTRIAVMSLDIMDMLNEVDFDKTGIKEIGMLFKGNVDYLNKFNNNKDVIDLGTHNNLLYTRLDLLDPELIILGSRVTSMENEFKKKYPKAEVYNATHGISEGDLTDTMKKNVDFLGKKFPNIKDDLETNYNSIVDDISNFKETNPTDARALVILLNGDKFTSYQEVSRFGMIYKEYGFKIAKHNNDSSNNDQQHGNQLDYEAIKEINPDVIFVLDRASTIGENNDSLDFKKFKDNEVLKLTNSYKTGNIISLDGDAWYMTSGGFNSARTMTIDMLKYKSN